MLSDIKCGDHEPIKLDVDLRHWKTKMSVGRMAYDAGLFNLAAHHFRGALQLVESENLPASILSQTLVNLAKTLGSIGHFQEGEAMLHRAISIDEMNGDLDQHILVELIEDYHQLSLLHWRSGKPELSAVSLKRAFELMHTYPKVPDELRAKLMKHNAVLTELNGDFELCEKMINEAIDFICSSNQLGKNSLIYGDCLMVKVMLLTELNRIDEAKEIYHEAKQILEFARGAVHPKMLELFESLADLASRKGLAPAAAALQQQAENTKNSLKKRNYS